MSKEIELLAPGGDVDSIKAAITAGADAVYCGLNKYNARNRASNIDFDNLNGIINLAHKNNCKVYLTLNIIIVQSELSNLIQTLNKLINTNIDGVIVQDFGLFYLLSKYFKGLKIHASTQLTTHNKGQIKFLNKLGACRVNLSRELNINEIKELTSTGYENNIEAEVFVHGSYCIGFSGICYISSVQGGKSGNRGRCSQPCRDQYLTTPEGKNFPLNLKDNSAYFDLRELYDAGVSSIKIEGRMKNFDYVYTVTNCWEKQIKSFYNFNKLNKDDQGLYKVFNRGFSNSFLKGDINKDMFIDNPRDNSIKQFSGVDDSSKNKKLVKEKIEYYADKEAILKNVKNKIKQLSIDKIPIIITISGKLDTPLEVSVKIVNNSVNNSFVVCSAMNLINAGRYTLNYDNLFATLKVLKNTGYHIKHFKIDDLGNDLFIPFTELTAIKKKIFSILNNSKELLNQVNVPPIKKHSKVKIKPALSILISSPEDLCLLDKTSADIFYQLPNYFKNKCTEQIDLFIKNKNLFPWFPSVLIGKNYSAAKEFLIKVQPKLIVTNNLGIAYEAYKNKIPWIAGPYLNIVNSFSLLCLKENFNCHGAFISNEINKHQIKHINKPEGLKLYYSIYHPILLLTSRQCLFHQVTGCEKSGIDEECINDCSKSSSITNLKNVPLLIKKSKASYHRIYNNLNFLNTDIVTDFSDTFSSFFIDLRPIKTETNMMMDKSSTIKLFEDFIDGNLDLNTELNQAIHPTTCVQYKKGI